MPCKPSVNSITRLTNCQRTKLLATSNTNNVLVLVFTFAISILLAETLKKNVRVMHIQLQNL